MKRTAAKGICNVPGCGTRAMGRGLCVKHYNRLKAANSEFRREAERYADPSRRAGGGTEAPEIEDQARPQTGTPSDRQIGDEIAETADEAVALVNIFAQHLGLPRSRYGDEGMIYENPRNGKRILVGADGRLRPVKIAIGEVLAT